MIKTENNTSECVPTCPAILSIVGWHANEGPDEIFKRKIDDIQRIGKSLWLYKSRNADVSRVAEFSRTHAGTTVYFLDGGSSAKPTKASTPASQISTDKINWDSPPKGIGNITGKLPAYCLIMDRLSLESNKIIDLWSYIDYDSLLPLVFSLGASTACVIPSPDGLTQGMKSRFRRVLAIGRLAEPFAVHAR